ncbi:MAG: dTDP-glucose 4,6-dehydratase [Candidatus Marinimicrobia bacterium]|jgi:dTDP-glucose 4,6-dehydratase|nr:dTDP-glucose 4,6-dehydratase [Candidatus Neomarinimicrobiota bacterium]MBT3501891.1 dTDP-glucose 4,6-dehydratase [Candidatus Neomarinimicrobiota bacterium]MBT3838583.1 dTDP-glucose 4,6-dehydratase [Candidatus Neomarinimicrobiota bacterium]MBT3999803.1 dTDP-glucose 4,6-dehydratase [Candidatus Neomarinimicrobiota bacterium]MBT4281858.1 dTDP-glucose 4,6-dehydratase [Candidatus Neomarinimicrobiota bacterium]
MKNILVTGGCGFIGSNYIHHVLKKNNDIHIINLDKMTYAGNINNLNGIPKEFHTFVKGDICDSELLKTLFESYQFEAVVHFAAESHVDRSIDGPTEFIQTNIVGTLNLLEHSRALFKKTNNDNFRFLHVSTDEVYGSLGDEGKFMETTAYDPSSPYSASKAGSDHLVRAWNRTFELPTLITNCSNNYGSYQFPEKLVPLMIINCLHGKTLPIYGKGENVRDWLYVRDHCEAIHTVLTSGTIGETYNVGGNNEIKNIDVVTIICSILDEISPKKDGTQYSNQISYVTDRPGHDFRYAIDANKIKKELNWTPNESFETGIRKTIQWYLDHESWWKAIQDNTYQQERLGVIES